MCSCYEEKLIFVIMLRNLHYKFNPIEIRFAGLERLVKKYFAKCI